MDIRVGCARDWGPEVAADRAILQIREAIFSPEGYVIIQQLFKSTANCYAVKEWVVNAELLSPCVDPYIVDFSARKSEKPVGQYVFGQQIPTAPPRGPTIIQAHESN